MLDMQCWSSANHQVFDYPCQFKVNDIGIRADGNKADETKSVFYRTKADDKEKIFSVLHLTLMTDPFRSVGSTFYLSSSSVIFWVFFKFLVNTVTLTQLKTKIRAHSICRILQPKCTQTIVKTSNQRQPCIGGTMSAFWVLRTGYQLGWNLLVVMSSSSLIVLERP